MYDAIRWTCLVLLFAGLLGFWLWSRRRAAQSGGPRGRGGKAFTVVQKRWVDKGTGVCLVESEGQTFLLAYSVGGGVSWQVLEEKSYQAVEADALRNASNFTSEAGRR